MSEEQELDLFNHFARAVELEPRERVTYLQDLEQRSPEVARELAALLASDQAGGRVPTRPDSSSGPLAELPQSLFSEHLEPGILERELNEIAATTTGFERYRSSNELGHGAMGEVHLARDLVLHRDLAIKTIRSSTAGPDSTARLARFLREARITARLAHPGIVPVYDLGVDEHGEAYYTMQLVKGREVASLLLARRNGDETWSQARLVSVLQRVCETMAYAHSRGVLHRDLKPSNVMVGEFGEVYVMDWGIARVTDSDTNVGVEPERWTAEDIPDPLLTREGVVVGTPYFMSPEQARGEVESLDQRTDIYAVGAMLYELLAGKRPYQRQGDSSREVLARIALGSPEPIARVATGAASELVAICERAMARDPEDRYADMNALAADLRAYQEDRVVRAHQTGPVAEFVKWTRRNRAVAVLAALMLITLLGAITAFALIQNAHARREGDLALDAKLEAEEAVRQQISADRGLGFLEDLFEAGNVWRSKDRDLTVKDLLDQGSARVVDEFRDDPLISARLQLTMGRTYRSQGDYPSAGRLLDRAYELRRSALGEVHLLTLEVLNERGLLAKFRGSLDDLARAEELYLEALAGHARAGTEGHREAINVMTNLAVVYMLRGDNAQALQYQLPAFEAAEQQLGPLDNKTLTAMNNLGNLYCVMQRYAEAEPILRESLNRLLEVEGRLSPRAPAALSNLGRTLLNLDAEEEALGLFEEAIDIGREIWPEGSASLCQSMRARVRLYLQRGDAARALPMCKELVEEARRVIGEEHRYFGAYQYYLAEAYLGTNQAHEARRELIELIARTAPTDRNLPEFRYQLGRVEEALENWHAADSIWTKLLDGDESPSDLARGVANQARLHLARSRIRAGAVREALDLAQECASKDPATLERYASSVSEARTTLEAIQGQLLEPQRQ